MTAADAPYERAWLGARFLVRPLGRVLLRPEVTGRANVPRAGGAVIAFNHVGYLDVLLLSQVLERPTRFMVAEGVLRDWRLAKAWLARELSALRPHGR